MSLQRARCAVLVKSSSDCNPNCRNFGKAGSRSHFRTQPKLSMVVSSLSPLGLDRGLHHRLDGCGGVMCFAPLNGRKQIHEYDEMLEVDVGESKNV